MHITVIFLCTMFCAWDSPTLRRHRTWVYAVYKCKCDHSNCILESAYFTPDERLFIRLKQPSVAVLTVSQQVAEVFLRGALCVWRHCSWTHFYCKISTIQFHKKTKLIIVRFVCHISWNKKLYFFSLMFDTLSCIKNCFILEIISLMFCKALVLF